MFAWFELMRLSNAPTVLTNVLAGVSIGMLARLSGTAPAWDTTALLVVGVLAVYAAGMVLNDACDARIDATERPARPVPSGRVSRGAALLGGLALLVGGTVVLCLASADIVPWALLLAASVLLYDVLHTQLPGSWLLLGLCRGLVIVIAARATSPGAMWPVMGWVAGGVCVYVALFSVAARDEMRSMRGAGRVATAFVPVAACAPIGLLFLDVPVAAWGSQAGAYAVLAVAFLVAAGASVRAHSGKAGVRSAVGSWIGAIALMDAAVCFLADQPFMGLACVGLWGVAGALRPRIAAS